MHLNIYYSKNFPQKNKFEEFFIENFLFKNKDDYLAGELIDIFFYDIKKFKNNDEFSIILVDDNLIDEIFDNKLESKIKLAWKQNNKKIIFIALSKNFSQLNLSSEINFVRAFDKDEDLFEFLTTEILHDILRYLLDKEKLKIFISHAKSDGRNIAKAIKEFIDSSIKLSNFFDEIDIMNSQKWDAKLKEEIEESLFLYILSDSYAQTLWTKKELIYARESFKPIVGIDILSSQTELSAMIANTKIFKLLQNIQNIEVNCKDKYLLHTKNNIRMIVNFLLKESLEFQLGKEKGINLPRKPDLFDVCEMDEDIVYPDPPMMEIELEEILKRCTNKKIYTPFTKNKKDINKKIAISISEPTDLEESGMRNKHLHLLMIEIARYLIINHATLIYGGDLGYKKEFNFTSILAETFRAYNNFECSKQKLINYYAYPFCEKIDINLKNENRDVIEFESCIGKKCDFEDIGIIADNLTKMREKITKEMDSKIAVGGKTSGFSGFYPGVLEEVYLALKANKSVVLIKGFGGIVDKIVDFIEGNEVRELTFKYQVGANPKLDRFLKENSLFDKVSHHYEEILSVIKKNKSLVKILEFEGFDRFIDKIIKVV